MAGLFKTGQELQQQRMSEMRELSVKQAREGFSGGVQKNMAGIGAHLGSALVGLFQDKQGGVEAGDIEQAAIEGGADPQTSEGLMKIQRAMFDSGDNESAMALDKHIKDRLTIESGLAKGKETGKSGGKGKASAVSPPSGNELASTRSAVFSNKTPFSENLASMMDSEDPFKMAQVDNMINGIATTTKSLEARLKDEGLIVNPHEIRSQLAERLGGVDGEGGVTRDESWFGGLFGVDGVIDVKAQDKVFKQAEQEVIKNLRALGNKSQPIKTEPGTKSTGQPSKDMLPVESLEDIAGSVEGAGTGSPVGVPIKEAESKAMKVIDQQVQARFDALQKATDPNLRKQLQDQLTKLGVRKATLARSMTGAVAQ